MNELNIEATVENLTQVIAFVEEKLETTECKPKTQMQIETAVEELFVNIARYAYAPDTGNATVRVEVLNEPLSVVITFIDNGVPYDPLIPVPPRAWPCSSCSRRRTAQRQTNTGRPRSH